MNSEHLCKGGISIAKYKIRTKFIAKWLTTNFILSVMSDPTLHIILLNGIDKTATEYMYICYIFNLFYKNKHNFKPLPIVNGIKAKYFSEWNWVSFSFQSQSPLPQRLPCVSCKYICHAFYYVCVAINLFIAGEKLFLTTFHFIKLNACTS